jgi:hypothetical protein
MPVAADYYKIVARFLRRTTALLRSDQAYGDEHHTRAFFRGPPSPVRPWKGKPPHPNKPPPTHGGGGHGPPSQPGETQPPYTPPPTKGWHGTSGEGSGQGENQKQPPPPPPPPPPNNPPPISPKQPDDEGDGGIFKEPVRAELAEPTLPQMFHQAADRDRDLGAGNEISAAADYYQLFTLRRAFYDYSEASIADGPDITPWVASLGTWSRLGGLSNDAPSADPILAGLATYGTKTDYQDVRITATVGATSNLTCAVGVRLTPGTGSTWNGYLWVLDDTSQTLYRLTNSVPTQLFHTTNPTPVVGTGTTIELTIQGTTLTAKANGATLTTRTDATYSSGRVGVANVGAFPVSYSSIVVTDRP